MSAANILDIVILLLGLYFLYGVWQKPKIFWEGRRIRRTRNVLGDEVTFWMYAIMGVIMTAVGIGGAYGAFG